MSQEWMRVVLRPEPSILIQSKSNGLSPIRAPSQSDSPSLVTLSQPIAAWPGVDEEYPQFPCSARLRPVPHDNETIFPLWVSTLNQNNPTSMKTSTGEDSSSAMKEFKIQDQDPLMLLRRISYTLSDVIVVCADKLEHSVKQFLDWVHSCRMFAQFARDDWENDRCLSYKPHACIIAPIGTTKQDFNNLCLQSDRAEGLELVDLEKIFEDYSVVTDEAHLKRDMSTYLAIARRKRHFKRHLWSQSSFHRLHAYYVESASQTPDAPLNVVRALSAFPSMELAYSRVWPEWNRVIFDVKQTGKFDHYFQHFVVPTMASCFSRDALKIDHGEYLLLHKICRNNTNEAFLPSELFDHIYRKLCHTLLPRDIDLQDLKDQMEQCMQNYEDGPNALHFRKLKSMKLYFKRTFSRKACFACLKACSQENLPCGHTICNNCLRDYINRESTSGILSTTSQLQICSTCPFCQKELIDFSVILHPPTAGGRVLFLDGGGVRGEVTLKVLVGLVDMMVDIGLSLPLHKMFDGIWGTSIGGIIAILIGMKKWTLQECSDQLGALATAVFGTHRSWMGFVGQALRLYRKGGIYDDLSVDEALRHAIGDDLPMLGSLSRGHNVRVGVITFSHRSEIMTNYSRSSCSAENSTAWAQEDDRLDELKAWEAARCTSAAPGYFPAKHLSFLENRGFYDGGLRDNYPGRVAEAEAKQLFPTGPLFVLSVGCGTYDEQKKDAAWWKVIRDVTSEFWRASRAADEHCRENPDYHRLDPRIPMEEPSLDNVAACSQLAEEARRIVTFDEDFRNHCLKPAFWHLIGALFYFEFTARPTDADGGHNCEGVINHRYTHAQAFQKELSDCFRGRAHFSICSECIEFDLPCTVNFRVASLDQRFGIFFHYGNQRAMISGLPSTAAALWGRQFDSQRGRRKPSTKRSLPASYLPDSKRRSS